MKINQIIIQIIFWRLYFTELRQRCSPCLFFRFRALARKTIIFVSKLEIFLHFVLVKSTSDITTDRHRHHQRLPRQLQQQRLRLQARRELLRPPLRRDFNFNRQTPW